MFILLREGGREVSKGGLLRISNKKIISVYVLDKVHKLTNVR